jgi:hypothetical protein
MISDLSSKETHGVLHTKDVSAIGTRSSQEQMRLVRVESVTMQAQACIKLCLVILRGCWMLAVSRQ